MPVYVLNNNSFREAREKLGEFYGTHSQVTILDSDVNLGVGVGRNYLVTHTKEDWLLFIDNDISMKTSKWLDRILKHIAEDKDIEVFVPRLYNVHERSFVSYHRSMHSPGSRVRQSYDLGFTD